MKVLFESAAVSAWSSQAPGPPCMESLRLVRLQFLIMYDSHVELILISINYCIRTAVEVLPFVSRYQFLGILWLSMRHLSENVFVFRYGQVQGGRSRAQAGSDSTLAQWISTTCFPISKDCQFYAKVNLSQEKQHSTFGIRQKILFHLFFYPFFIRFS